MAVLRDQDFRTRWNTRAIHEVSRHRCLPRGRLEWIPIVRLSRTLLLVRSGWPEGRQVRGLILPALLMYLLRRRSGGQCGKHWSELPVGQRFSGTSGVRLSGVTLDAALPVPQNTGQCAFRRRNVGDAG